MLCARALNDVKLDLKAADRFRVRSNCTSWRHGTRATIQSSDKFNIQGMFFIVWKKQYLLIPRDMCHVKVKRKSRDVTVLKRYPRLCLYLHSIAENPQDYHLFSISN